MNLEDLQQELERKKVPKRAYSLKGWKDERVCIEKRDGIWYVYFVERGKDTQIRAFHLESEACEHMLEMLKYDAQI